MHDGEAEIDADLVRRLVAGRFPEWAGLPVERLDSGGTVNAIYRLGAELTVRLPLTRGGVRALERERRWSPVLAPGLPVAIPAVVGVGAPAEGYPWSWAVHRWIDGEPAVEGTAPEGLAHDLAGFIKALRGIKSDGPGAYRGGPLAAVDAETRAAIERLSRADEPFDASAALTAWQEALTAPPWTAAPVWLHSDMMPSNILVAGGRLAAVLDFATAGLGDPACDLIPAWNLLPPPARTVFRTALDADDATWARGRGWALSMALIQLPYYRATNRVISANARHTIAQILTSGGDLQ